MATRVHWEVGAPTSALVAPCRAWSPRRHEHRPGQLPAAHRVQVRGRPGRAWQEGEPAVHSGADQRADLGHLAAPSGLARPGHPPGSVGRAGKRVRDQHPTGRLAPATAYPPAGRPVALSSCCGPGRGQVENPRRVGRQGESVSPAPSSGRSTAPAVTSWATSTSRSRWYWLLQDLRPRRAAARSYGRSAWLASSRSDSAQPALIASRHRNACSRVCRRQEPDA
jgi:hypothetical protein